MSENKFIRHLQGKDTAKSVLEIKNQNTPTSFADMPNGTSNANDVYSDPRGDAVGVLKGSDNWKLDGQNLVEATTVYGDGRDLTTTYQASGATLWVNSTYTFSSAKRFNPNTKFVLKLCGHSLDSDVDAIVDFSLIITFGNTIITKTFRESIYAFNFCKEFVIDFAESNQSAIKVDTNDTMQVQLLCSDATASAVIYNGMTVFTALQRRVDGEAVASDKKTFDEVVDDVEQLQEDLDDLEEYVDETFVKKAGDTMTGTLHFQNYKRLQFDSAYTGVYGYFSMSSAGVLTYSQVYNNGHTTLTYTFNYYNGGIHVTPSVDNKFTFGTPSYRFNTVCTKWLQSDGAACLVPSPAQQDVLATKSDVDLAANSGRMITDQGVWFAKMYAATVVPTGAEYDGKNYADFSQVDAENNPVIKIYTGASGVWTLSETITPPAEYDGYVPITSKIWDIAEQTGQQGGRILWNHQSKQFTPYPQIVSFDGQNITNSTFSGGTITNSTFSGTATLSGTSTVVMPQDPTGDQIVNKDYVDNHIPTGNFYHPDLFDWKWADHQVNDVQWLRADTFSWQSGSVYQAAFDELFYDIQISTYWYGGGGPAYTKSRTPAVGDAVYLNSDLTTQIGTIEAYDDANDEITVSGSTYTFMSNTYVTPTTETVAGYSVSVYTGHSGRKIVNVSDETNVANIYAATGVAWYYIIDIPNKRFKLPRTKWGVTGYRDGVGNYVDAGLPNITGSAIVCGQNDKAIKVKSYTGAFKAVGTGSVYNDYDSTSQTTTYGIALDASDASSVYGASTTVQPRATQMYLYFYVGEFTQTAIENTAGLNASLFNGKVDVGHEVIAFQAPTAENNYTWYRKYADGWVEQGGVLSVASNSQASATLPVVMADTNYTITNGFQDTSNTKRNNPVMILAVSTTSITLGHQAGATMRCHWQVSGMAA